MMTNKNIKVELVVTPNMQIVTKLAADYIRRATTHLEHSMMFEATGLTTEDIANYFADLLVLKAVQVQDERLGKRIFNKENDKLRIPVGFTPFTTAIGDVETEEYQIHVVCNSDLILKKSERTEISEKLYQLDKFMPTVKKQFKPGEFGNEAMFAIVDTTEDIDVTNVSTFTGKSIDDALLAISAVLGLKVQSQGMNCLYPNFRLIDVDQIRNMFIDTIEVE